MIFFESNSYQELQKILNSSILSENFDEWSKYLDKEETAFVDGFINYLTHENSSTILSRLGFSSLKEWLDNVEAWNTQILDPRNESKPEALILYNLWAHILNSLTKSIRHARLIADIPRKGGILYYFGGMSKCIILKYEIFSDYPNFQFVDMIDNPKSAFDFWGIMNYTGTKEKNILKEILSTGHKMIFHRGVLIHVDRRKDIEVFGPTIDTILIAEILSQQVFETSNSNIKNALEIGCGNGLITVAIAKNCSSLKKIQAIDINFNSISCCHRNLRGNLNPFRFSKLDIWLHFGKFSTNLFNDKFDLIVCNPPYIPLINGETEDFYNKKDYFEAVGGLSLIAEIMNSLSIILNEDGRLLILVSELSLEYTLSKIPEGYSYKIAIENGFEVLFDVEAVLNNRKWLDYLLETGHITTQSESFYHKLYPIWVKKE